MKVTNKKSTKKIKSIKIASTRWYFIILSVVVLGLVAAVALLACYTHALWRDRQSDQSVIKGYIRDAVEGLYKPTVVNPESRKQYVYEASARFNLPAPYAQPFRYSYQALSEDSSENIVITTDAALRTGYAKLQSPNIFDHLPQYHRCARMFSVIFGNSKPIDDSLVLFTSKTLADGRMAKLYKNNSCDSFYYDSGMDMATYQQVIESIESY